MKKLYLHMGFQKTGSSSFQVTCLKNIGALLDQGYVYPLLSESQSFRKNNPNHSFLFNTVFKNDPRTNFEFTRLNIKDANLLHSELLASIKDAFSIDKNLILSTESIQDMQEYELVKFKEYLESFQLQIIPIILLRSPYSTFCSLSQQAIKTGRVKSEKVVLQSPLVTKILKYFPETKIFSFSVACKHAHGPTGFLLEKIGINYQDFELITTNEGISNTIVRIQNKLNQIDPFIINGKLNQHFINIIDLDCKKSFPQKFLLCESEYAALKDDFEAENAYFRKHFGEEFCDKEIKFAPENDPVVMLCTGLIDRLENKFHRKDKLLIQDCHINKFVLSATLWYIKITYFRYRIATELTYGERKKRYKEKKIGIKKNNERIC